MLIHHIYNPANKVAANYTHYTVCILTDTETENEFFALLAYKQGEKMFEKG